MAEIFVSIDIESDGPCPGLNSMLSFGAAAYTTPKKLISTFYRVLDPLADAKQDPDTMKWWSTQTAAWEAMQKTPKVDPYTAMVEFKEWLASLNGKTVAVCYPAGFDFTFIYYYLNRFVGKSPLGFSCLDIKSYAMAMLQTAYKNTTKSAMPKHWFPDHKHTHIALDDAIEQGELFINMLEENTKPVERVRGWV